MQLHYDWLDAVLKLGPRHPHCQSWFAPRADDDPIFMHAKRTLKKHTQMKHDNNKKKYHTKITTRNKKKKNTPVEESLSCHQRNHVVPPTRIIGIIGNTPPHPIPNTPPYSHPIPHPIAQDSHPPPHTPISPPP